MIRLLQIIFLSALGLIGFEGLLQAQSPAVPPSVPKKGMEQYEQIDLNSLSKLYWAIGKMDPENPAHINNYLLINECNLYTDFYFNELEWKDIFDSTQQHLMKNSATFPVRFEFVQPLYLGKYDLNTQTFEIMDEFRYKGLTRFEVIPADIAKPVCGNADREVQGYPKGLEVEFNRPFILEKIAVPRKIAEPYIREKLAVAQETSAQNLNDIYNNRQAYIVVDFKVLGNNGDRVVDNDYTLAKVFAVLEKLEVYLDKERKILVLSKDFLGMDDFESSRDSDMKRIYQERLKQKLQQDGAPQ